MFKGFGERIKDSLVKVAHEGTEIKCLVHANRQNAVWIGAAKMCSIGQFVNDTMITKGEFEELGARGAVNKKNP